MSDVNQLQNNHRFIFSCKKLLGYLGPGFLISMAFMDPGNLAGNIYCGQAANYRLLWVLLWATVLGFLFQFFSLRLGVVAGIDMATLCRKFYPKKSRILLWLMAEIAIIGADMCLYFDKYYNTQYIITHIQEVLGTAIALNIIFDVQMWFAVLITICSTFFILLAKLLGQRFLEVIFGLLILMMIVSFVINLVIVGPDVKEMMYGLIIPTIPQGSDMAVIGLVGAIIQAQNLYLHTNLMNEPEKKIDLNNKMLVKETIIYNTIETGFSLFLSFIINGAVISTFAMFHDVKNINLLNAGDVLETNFGASAKYIWAIGLFAAGQASTLTGTLVGQYVMEGYLDLKVSPFMRALLTRSIAIIPAFIIVFQADVTKFNDYLNVLQVIQLPFAVVPMVRFCLMRAVSNQYVMTKCQLIAVAFFTFSIVGMNYYSQFNQSINWNSIWPYVIILVGMGYLLFLYIISVQTLYLQPGQEPLQVQKEHFIQNFKKTQDQKSIYDLEREQKSIKK